MYMINEPKSVLKNQKIVRNSDKTIDILLKIGKVASLVVAGATLTSLVLDNKGLEPGKEVKVGKPTFLSHYTFKPGDMGNDDALYGLGLTPTDKLRDQIENARGGRYIVSENPQGETICHYKQGDKHIFKSVANPKDCRCYE